MKMNISKSTGLILGLFVSVWLYLLGQFQDSDNNLKLEKILINVNIWNLSFWHIKYNLLTYNNLIGSLMYYWQWWNVHDIL